MNKNFNRVRSQKLSLDLAERLEQAILGIVKRSPGHQIPAQELGRYFGLTHSQVSTRVKHMVRMGKLIRLSRYTYELPKANQDQNVASHEPAKIPKLQNNDAFLQKLMKYHYQFTLETESDRDSLRRFLLYVNKRENVEQLNGR